MCWFIQTNRGIFTLKFPHFHIRSSILSLSRVASPSTNGGIPRFWRVGYTYPFPEQPFLRGWAGGVHVSPQYWCCAWSRAGGPLCLPPQHPGQGYPFPPSPSLHGFKSTQFQGFLKIKILCIYSTSQYRSLLQGQGCDREFRGWVWAIFLRWFEIWAGLFQESALLDARAAWDCRVGAGAGSQNWG